MVMDNIENPFLDEDLAEIISARIALRAKKIIELIYGIPYERRSKNALRDMIIEGTLEKFRKHEIEIRLSGEIQKYKKRNRGRGYLSDIEKAREGNNESLCRLIAWDKAWLFISWVREKILEAQENGDMSFIVGVGNAVSKEPGMRTVINAADKDRRRRIIDFVEAVIVDRQKDSIPEIIDSVHEWLNQEGFLPEELSDKQYFVKYLKRHNVI